MAERHGSAVHVHELLVEPEDARDVQRDGGERLVHLEEAQVVDVELRALQNGNWFHVCSSETEGFGHYLVEAMSVGAVTLTTAAPPMNELVEPDRGILVPYARMDTQFLANTYFFDEVAAEAAIERMIAMPEDEMQCMGTSARAWFLRNDRGFSERLRLALMPLFD